MRWSPQKNCCCDVKTHLVRLVSIHCQRSAAFRSSLFFFKKCTILANQSSPFRYSTTGDENQSSHTQLFFFGNVNAGENLQSKFGPYVFKIQIFDSAVTLVDGPASDPGSDFRRRRFRKAMTVNCWPRFARKF